MSERDRDRERVWEENIYVRYESLNGKCHSLYLIKGWGKGSEVGWNSKPEVFCEFFIFILGWNSVLYVMKWHIWIITFLSNANIPLI